MDNINQPLEIQDIEAIQTGMVCEDGIYTCQLCGAQFEPGEVYPAGGRFYQAEKAAQLHAELAHPGALERLLDNRYLSLTDHQKRLMRMLAEGRSDNEIAEATGTTAATVRRQRFAFREKAKQAKTYLAAYALMLEQKARPQALAATEAPAALAPPPPSAGSGNGNSYAERFSISEAENERYLRSMFSSIDPPRLRALPSREKRRVAALRLIAKLFEPNVAYAERQVNEILKDVFPGDYVTLRRYLVEYGFLEREADGSRYWVA